MDKAVQYNCHVRSSCFYWRGVSLLNLLYFLPVSDYISVTEKRPPCSLQARLLFRCCSTATFHPRRDDELEVKSQALLFLARLGLCAWVVAATGRMKNRCSGESSRPAADEKSVLRLRGKNTYFTEHGEETWRAKDEVEGIKNYLCGTAVLSWQEELTEHLHKAWLSTANYLWIIDSVQPCAACECNKPPCAHITLCVRSILQFFSMF